MFVTNDRALVRRALITDHHHFDKGRRVFEAGQVPMGNGLTTCADVDQVCQRPAIQTAFRPDPMPHYARTTADSAQPPAPSRREHLADAKLFGIVSG
ncbi:hypothetical protein [Embleya sp. NPDC005971]|uniref:hypothetical protein n=1 Tax=Embleya sp. NPDC005971 TaxID=3156724 RepID=UPI0033E9C399